MLRAVSWLRERGAHDRLASVSMRERERPLAPVRELIDRRIQSLRAAGVDAIATEPVALVTTTEGELAAVVTMTGTRDGRDVEHTLGVIYGDDFQTVFDGRSEDPSQRAAVREVVRELVEHVPIALGTNRYRRYLYRPPVGWQGRARGLVTDWFPVDYPRTDATIKVHPARPLAQSAHAVRLDALLRDDRFDGFVPEQPIVREDIVFGAFKGTLGRAVGHFPGSPRRIVATAALDDGRYHYVMRLNTAEPNAAAHGQVLVDLVRSCVPLPVPDAISAIVMDVIDSEFAHWVD